MTINTAGLTLERLAKHVDAVSGAPLTLADLTDVSSHAPEAGEVLTWNAGSSLWEPSAAGAPGAHALDGASHTVSGLTSGHFVKALSAATFGFAAHGLTHSDVGALAAAGTAADSDKLDAQHGSYYSGLVTTHAGLTTTAHGLGASAFHADAFFAPAAGSSSIVTVGALNAGSITSGFGSIDIGADALTCGALTVNGTWASGTYSADVLAASGATRSILRAGVAGVTNGFAVNYTVVGGIAVSVDGTLGCGAFTATTGTFTAAGSLGSQQVNCYDSTAQAAGTGGGIWFAGKYTNAGAYIVNGTISARKTNSTDGDYGFGLSFKTISNGSGGLAERMWLSEVGALTLAAGLTATTALFSSTLHVDGAAEFDSTAQFDAAVTTNSTLTAAGGVQRSIQSANRPAAFVVVSDTTPSGTAPDGTLWIQTGAGAYTPTAHNLLSTYHGDTLADTVVRGDLLVGNATPKWARLAFPATPTGKVVVASATDVAWSASALGSAAWAATSAFDAAGAAAAVTPTTLGLVIGTNVQAYSAKLGTFSALADAAGWLHSNGGGAYAWSAPGYGDVGAAPAAGSSSIATVGTVTAGHWHADAIDAGYGGTGQLGGYAVGDLLYASGAAALSKLADVAVGSYLRSGGVTTAPLWSTLVLPNAATAYRLPVATGVNTIGELAAVGATGEYLKGNTGAIPSWATLNQAAVAGLTTADGPTFDHLHLTNGLDAGAVLTTEGGARRTIQSAYRPAAFVIVSTEDPSGSAPDGTLWIKI